MHGLQWRPMAGPCGAEPHESHLLLLQLPVNDKCCAAAIIIWAPRLDK